MSIQSQGSKLRHETGLDVNNGRLKELLYVLAPAVVAAAAILPAQIPEIRGAVPGVVREFSDAIGSNVVSALVGEKLTPMMTEDASRIAK